MSVPSGAGADVGVAVVMRTGTIAVGTFGYQPPTIMTIQPDKLVFGEVRPILVCGASFGAELPVERRLTFGGRPCTGVSDISLANATTMANDRGGTIEVSQFSLEMLPVASCLICNQLEWSDDDLSGLVAWSGAVSVLVAGQSAEFSAVDLGTAPRVIGLEAGACSDTTGGSLSTVIRVSGFGFGTSPLDVEYVLLSGFDLEQAALAAGFNSTSVISGTREGIVNGSKLMEPASLAAMGIHSWQLAAALPVVGTTSVPVIPTGNVNATVLSPRWVSRELIELILPPGAGHGIQVRVQLLGGAVSRPLSLAYCPPSIDEDNPVAVLAGDSEASILLRGRSFPLVIEQLTDLRIGGVQCHRVELVEPGRAVRCVGLKWIDPAQARANASSGLDGIGVIGSVWPSDGSLITVAGQES